MINKINKYCFSFSQKVKINDMFIFVQKVKNRYESRVPNNVAGES